MKMIVTAATCIATMLFVSVSLATAAERVHARKPHHVVSKSVCHANASMATPVMPAGSEPSYYRGGWSAPAGH